MPKKQTTKPVNADCASPVKMKHDPWQHRAKGMNCFTCMWFVEKGCLGRCRRRAPTMSGYPVVFPSDWCGDHKLDETRV